MRPSAFPPRGICLNGHIISTNHTTSRPRAQEAIFPIRKAQARSRARDFIGRRATKTPKPPRTPRNECFGAKHWPLANHLLLGVMGVLAVLARHQPRPAASRLPGRWATPLHAPPRWRRSQSGGLTSRNFATSRRRSRSSGSGPAARSRASSPVPTRSSSGRGCCCTGSRGRVADSSSRPTPRA